MQTFRKEKVTDAVLPDLTIDDLKSLGLSLGEARSVKKEAGALSAPPSPALTPPASSVAHPPSAAAAAAAAAPVPVMSCPADERTLLTSEFKRLHDAAECPELQHELFASIYVFIMGICERHNVPPAAGKNLFHRLQGESFENPKSFCRRCRWRPRAYGRRRRSCRAPAWTRL
jgi:hypothetical protein